MRSTSRTTRLLSTIQEEQAAVEAKVATARRAPTPASKAIVFGLVNAVAAVPSLIAYAAIVFKVRRASKGGGDECDARPWGAPSPPPAL